MIGPENRNDQRKSRRFTTTCTHCGDSCRHCHCDSIALFDVSLADLWHGIFQRLYYLPVVYAAIAFGWIGGLAAAVAAALLYIPHIVMMWGHEQHYAMEQYAEIFMFLAVGIVTGVLSDRERKRRNELQITARKLSQVYRELQDTFEQVKRADRLSAIGQLAAGLAHEIRNPLASIDGAAEVLDVADERPELRKEHGEHHPEGVFSPEPASDGSAGLRAAPPPRVARGGPLPGTGLGHRSG